MADKPTPEDQKRDEVLRRMLNTPPKPHSGKKSETNKGHTPEPGGGRRPAKKPKD